jgi:glycosyltransferase involved in cell wall biosynthesis
VTVVFDLQALQSAHYGDRGIGRYVGELAAALAAGHPGAVDVFAWNDRFARPARLDELAGVLGDRLHPFSALRDRAVDVLHVNAPFEPAPYATIAVPVRPRRTVVTCFDLIPYRFPQIYLADARAAARYRTRLAMLAAADAIVTDSQSAADDLVNLLGADRGRITVIGGGVGARFTPPTAPLADRLAELRGELPTLEPRYVLVPGGVDWRKNLPRMVEAFGLLPAELRTRHQLVLACSMDDGFRGWIDHLAREAGLAERMLITGPVPDETMVTLYQSAELVVFPSLYEGFGLPALEARRSGARVIAAAAAAIPEVLHDARALFDPWDAAAIAAMTARALTDDEFAGVLDRVPVPDDLTWEIAADRLAEVYRCVRPSSRPPAAQGGPLRLAFVTLLPPTPSGIADHSRRLLTALHEQGVAVTAFVQRTATAADWPFPAHDLATLYPRWRAGEFDEVVYAMGNYHFHRDFLDAMRLVPGHAFVHDVRQRWAFDPFQFETADAEFYGGAADDTSLFVRPVAAAARSLFVQSQHAAELIAADLTEWTGPAAPVVDIGPHPCPPDEPAGEDPDDGPPWVVAMGIAHESKQSDKFVEMARVLLDVGEPPVRIAMVGLGGGRFTTEADRARMTVTEHVTDDEFRAWMHCASLLVQLRGESNGESSGVFARACSAGVPMVVSELGAMAEAPDEIAHKVPVDVTPEALAAAVAGLLADEPRRRAMSAAARAYAARETYAAQARRLLAALRPADR